MNLLSLIRLAAVWSGGSGGILLFARFFGRTAWRIRKAILKIGLTIGVILLIICGWLVTRLGLKGVYAKEILNANFTESLNFIRFGPSSDEKTLPDSLRGQTVIFYRFGCEDCDAIYPALKEAAAKSGLDTVWYIPSRSEKGNELRETVQITTVPSAAYFGYDGLVYVYPLDKKTEGIATFNDESWNRVLELTLEKR